jgi:Rab guanine nucleotide exchange factor SEC2
LCCFQVHVQNELSRMMDRVLSETTLRESAESDKAVFEHELDELSASLFEEANRMVAVEKYARSVADGKSQSLEERLRDTESLMSAQAVQLRDLGEKLEAAEQERDRLRSVAEGDPPEKTEASETEERKATVHHRNNSSIYSVGNMPLSPPFQPRPPFDVSHSLPRLMTDIVPFHEFVSFVRYLRQLRIQSLSTAHHPPSSPSKQGAVAPEVYVTNGSGNAQPSPEQLVALFALAPLSVHISQPFVKRSIEEDSDPTMRLDIAPGLNWLSRRDVSKAVVEGTLVIEPAFGTTASAAAGQGRCALCGVSVLGEVSAPVREEATRQSMRKWVGGVGSWSGFALGGSSHGASSPSRSGSETPPLAATRQPASASTATKSDSVPSSLHVFRTSDMATARYPLCSLYCLPRLRAACEYWAFVRTLERGLLLDERFGPALAPLLPPSQLGGRKPSGLIGGFLRRTSSSLDEQRFSTSSPAIPPPVPPPVPPRHQLRAQKSSSLAGLAEARSVERDDTETGKSRGEEAVVDRGDEDDGRVMRQQADGEVDKAPEEAQESQEPPSVAEEEQTVEADAEAETVEPTTPIDTTTSTPASSSDPTTSSDDRRDSPSTPRAGSPTNAAEGPAPSEGLPLAADAPAESSEPTTSAEPRTTGSRSSESATTSSSQGPPPGEKPPVPPRSDSRHSKASADGLSPCSDASDSTPQDGSRVSPSDVAAGPVTPQRRTQPPPRPPPRHPRSPAGHPTFSHAHAVSYESAGGASTTAAPAPEVAAGADASRDWEERCWAEIVKLKEVMFWTRTAAKLRPDHDVTAAGALSRLSVH